MSDTNIKIQVKEYLGDKKILIWGMGREGISTYRFLRKHLPDMCLWLADSAEQNMSLFENCRFLKADKWLAEFDEFDIIFKTPGIPIADKAINLDKITSQTEFFLRFYRNNTIGITGTKGKSTTSSLLHHILKGNGINSVFLGNIGVPCLDKFDDMTEDTVAVFEMSCHQLECCRCSPYIGVLLNLYEDHLDHYGTYELFVRAKENIFRHQKPGDIIILNKANQDQIKKSLNPVTISPTGEADETADIYFTDNSIVSNSHSLDIATSDTCLAGRHNRYNISVVYYICREIFNINDECFKRELRAFKGLPHRLEYIGKIGGIIYYDDSISTTCETTIQALTALKDSGEVGTVLIGGMDRGINYEPLVDFLSNYAINNVILMPDTHERIYNLFAEKNKMQHDKKHTNIVIVKDLSEAVKIARQCTDKGKICLLSPAAASYGFFKNFEDRGKQYQRMIYESDNSQ